MLMIIEKKIIRIIRIISLIKIYSNYFKWAVVEIFKWDSLILYEIKNVGIMVVSSKNRKKNFKNIWVSFKFQILIFNNFHKRWGKVKQTLFLN